MSVQTHGYINNAIDGNHLIGLGGLPTVVLGPGAGAGSATITGTDTAFTLSITAGAGTAINSIICTIIFSTAFTAIPHTTFSPKNNNAAAANARYFVNNVSTSQLTLNITNPALSSGTTYLWTFLTLG